MKTKQHTIKALTSVCAILALAGSLLAVNGWAQTAETEGSTEPDISAMLDKLTETAIEADVSAAQQAAGSPSQQRRASKEARRQATLERNRTVAQEMPLRQEPSTKQETSPKQEAALQQAALQKQEVSQKAAVPATVPLADIDVSFKLDPRLAKVSPAGDGWVAPPINSGLQEGTFTVEARVQGRDAKGQPVDISPEWRAGDPSVQISPSQGSAVKITVRDSGESNLTLTALGFSKDLWISAINQGKAIQVRISQ